MGKIIPIITVCLLLAVLWAHQPPGGEADGWTVDMVNETKETRNVTFEPGGGQDDTTFIQIPDGVPVYKAKLGVRGFSHTGNKYPENIWMDVGKDGDIDWMYWGEGYGALGRQTLFLSNESSETVAFIGEGTNGSARIRLPYGAEITKARMDVSGRAGPNDGVMVVKNDVDSECRLYCYSSGATGTASDPRLVVDYAGGTSVTVQPDEDLAKDARISMAGPGTNYGDSWSILYGYSTYNYEERALMAFDISAVDPEKEVLSATLGIRGWSYSATQQWGAHRITEHWNEMGVTFENQPAREAVPEDNMVTGPGSGSRWFEWDVTNMLGEWLTVMPANVTVDVGNDGSYEYEMEGSMNYTQTTEDFTDSLNDYMASAPPTYVDDYGNKFVDVPIMATSNTSATLRYSNLLVEYDHTATVFKNPHNFNLTNEINELMDEGIPSQGLVTVHINVHSETAGKLQFRDIDILYNGDPVLLGNPPSNLSLDEDTSADHFLNLSAYFEDDFLPPGELDYKVVGNSREGTVNVFITEDIWLTVDSDSLPKSENWNGPFNIRIRATDEMGFFAETDDFTITVNPVNDEPVKGTVEIPDMSLSEGGNSQPLDLDADDYFTDVESDELSFTPVVDILNTYDGENITVDVDPETKEMVIRAHGDFAGDDIPVRIFCDDGVGEPAGVYQDILVDVVNANDDPPSFTGLPDVEVEEDSSYGDAFRLHDYVYDVDNTPDELRYTIASQTNASQVSVKIDVDGYVDIKCEQKNWTGTSTVTVRAADDGGNTGQQSFTITVTPVNDAPVASLKSPGRTSIISSSRVTLQWDAVDAETPPSGLTYIVYMGENAADAVLVRDINGTSYEADVQDGRTYHWTVAASDGTLVGPKARERVFTVDFGSGPRVSLESPQDGAFVTSGSAGLTWTVAERPSGLGGAVKYDVYLGTDAGAPKPVKTGLAATTWEAEGLSDATTYYWRVIPSDNLGEGTCVSGSWSFQVDFGFAGYGVGLTAAPAEMTVSPGGTGAVTAKITNNGAADDNYKLTGGMPDIPGAIITIDSEDPADIPIDLDGSRDVTVTVLIPGSTGSGSYPLTLTAKSLKGGMEETITVTVTVRGGGSAVDGTDGADIAGEGEAGLFGGGRAASSLALVLIVVIVLMGVIMGLMSLMYKKKSDRVDELEGRRRLEPASMLDAELAFSPDGAAGTAVGGAGAVGADRQLGYGAGAGEGGPGGAPAMEPLALPKVATGGERAPEPAVPLEAETPGDAGEPNPFMAGGEAPEEPPAEAPGVVGQFMETTPGAAGAGAVEQPKPKPRPKPRPRAGPAGDGAVKPRPPGGEARPGPKPEAPAKPRPGEPEGEGDGEKPAGGGAGKKAGAPAKKEGGIGTLPGEK